MAEQYSLDDAKTEKQHIIEMRALMSFGRRCSGQAKNQMEFLNSMSNKEQIEAAKVRMDAQKLYCKYRYEIRKTARRHDVDGFEDPEEIARLAERGEAELQRELDAADEALGRKKDVPQRGPVAQDAGSNA